VSSGHADGDRQRQLGDRVQRPSRQRRPARLAAGPQETAHQPVPAGQRAGRGTRHAAPGPDQQPRCAVELTEIRTRGQDWWTLGFETTGPADLLRSELQATVALVFAHALPGGAEPGPDQSRSYTEWLSPRPSPESHP
jgi:hypothetical protein